MCIKPTVKLREWWPRDKVLTIRCQTHEINVRVYRKIFICQYSGRKSKNREIPSQNHRSDLSQFHETHRTLVPKTPGNIQVVSHENRINAEIIPKHIEIFRFYDMQTQSAPTSSQNTRKYLRNPCIRIPKNIYFLIFGVKIEDPGSYTTKPQNSHKM